MPMVFCVYSGFLNLQSWPPIDSWNIVEGGLKHHKPNRIEKIPAIDTILYLFYLTYSSYSS